jgi:excisionase family DNA binding protein
MKPRASTAMPASGSAATVKVAAPIPTLLTVTDVAELFRLKPAAVRALARRGDLGFVRVGRAIRFRPGDLEAYLERQRRPARGERALAAAGL